MMYQTLTKNHAFEWPSAGTMFRRGLCYLAVAIAIMIVFAGFVGTAEAADGVSKVVGNLAGEAKSSYDGIKVVVGLIGFLMVVGALIMFATHRQGKSLATPILLLLFGGAMLAAPFIASISGGTTAGDQAKTVDQLLGSGG
ncbi:hypothetical protein [Thiolapillus sp.]|nr:hypothetical protein [Thiolapillus sp.]